MASTYEPIATQTLGSAAASVTFSSIPATYTDLVLIANGQAAASQNNFEMQFNGDTATNYSDTYLSGSGSAASSGRETSKASILIGNYGNPPASGSSFDIVIINIMNYANTTTYKTALTRANNAANGVDAIVGLWRSTSAITSVTVFIKSSNNLNTGSSFTLYGIKAA